MTTVNQAEVQDCPEPAPGAPVAPLIGASGLAGRAVVASSEERPITLGACFDYVGRHPDVPARFRQEIPAVRALIERLTGRDAGELPSDPMRLRPSMAGLQLKTFAAAHRRWNAQSVLKSTLILTGWIPPEAAMRYKLPALWEDRLIAAERHGKRKPLAAFFRYCHRLGLDLQGVTSATLIGYVDWLAKSTLIPDPWATAIGVQAAWSHMQARDTAWSAAQLQLPNRRKSPFAIRADLRPEHLIGRRSLATRPLIAEEAACPANLGGCLELIAAHPDVPERFRRDAHGVIATLARVTGQNIADLPTDPVALRPILAAVQPIRFKLSNKRWRNILAVIRSTLILCGWVSADSRKRQVLPPPWADLLARAERDQLDRALAPFFRFCQRQAVTPEAVSSDTLRAYVDWLTRSTLEPTPRRTAHRVQAAWRRMQRSEPAWPGANITLPSGRMLKRRNDFSGEFASDLAAYLESLTRYHPRDPSYGHPLAPASIRGVRISLLRAATFLVASGTPASEITGIAALATPAAYEAILLAAHADAGERWSGLAQQIAHNLLIAARRWVKSPESVLRQLAAQCSCVRLRRSDRRRRDLLAQFDMPDSREELFSLPWRAFEQADLMLKKGSREPAAKLHETALALAILFTSPMRIRNLAALDIAKHFRRGRGGRLKRIFVDAGEVKNSVAIEVLLPDHLAARIERHLERFRPMLLRGAPSTALFPGNAGAAVQANTLGRHIRRMAERQLGARFTPHMARHIAAELLLEKDVNNLPIAQRLLGHTRAETTASIYGLVRTSTAQRVYANLLEQDRAAAAARETWHRRRRTP